MARPELRDALDSLAAQTYADLEVVLVDATGGRHPLPPPTCGPHGILFVGGAAPRSRPVAANAGLDAATGDYIGFLDDDDRLLPDHVSGLAAALDARPDCAVAYAKATEVGSDGTIVAVRAEPFSRVLLFQDSYVMLQASLFRRELRETCRFDPAFAVFEDWDFWIQASRVTDFLPVAQQTVIYRSDLGRSGIGRGANRDPAVVEAYRRRIAEKWRVEGERAMRDLRQRFDAANSHFAAGDRTRAEAGVREVLDLYRFDVDALVLAGTLAALRGAFPEASSHFALAARESPTDADVHFNLAQSLEREGRTEAAVASYRRVVELDPKHPHARLRLARIDAIGRG